MDNCPFCKFDNSLFYNQTIDETKNFLVKPVLGSLVDGYVMIVSKEHVNSMIELDNNIIKEYDELMNKYREIFKKVYNKYPICFEHGTLDENGFCSGCVVHAHTHIVNHNYKNESKILEELEFQEIDDFSNIEFKNYIFYRNPFGKDYISYNKKTMRQAMRIFIAKDLGIEEKYNWRQYPFYENIKSTLEKIKLK